ncbi:MAG: CHAT domain-containing protein [Chloroflexi bacterium]|nr:CHAT domain-containing protein [Chloroflexota bacterium]
MAKKSSVPQYYNLDLEIQRAEPPTTEANGQSLPYYQIEPHFEHGIGDFKSKVVLLTLDQPKIDKFYEWVRYQRLRATTGSAGTLDFQEAEEMGYQLFRFLFVDGSLNQEESLLFALERAVTKAIEDNCCLRLRLKLRSPELQNLPWEYLCKPGLPENFLSIDGDFRLARYLEIQKKQPTTKLPRPVRILGLVGGDLDGKKPMQQKWLKELEELKQTFEEAGKVAGQDFEVVVPGPLSFKELDEWLDSQEQFHILHYLGHGDFDAEGGKGCLLLGNGKEDKIYGDKLAVLLNGQRRLQLVMLNACHTAKSSLGDRFSSVAAGLVPSNVPAVIAMQFDVLGPTAVNFSKRFYYALAQGLTLEEALVKARKAIFLHHSKIEFGVPVLYSRISVSPCLFKKSASQKPLSEAAPSVLETSDRKALQEEVFQHLDRYEQVLSKLVTDQTQEREEMRQRIAALEKMLEKLVALQPAQPVTNVSPTPVSVDTFPAGGTKSIRFNDESSFLILDATALLPRGIKLYEEGVLEKARQYFEAAIKKAPRQRADLYFWLGKTLLALEKSAEAAQNFEQAIKLKPDYVEAYLQLAQAWRDLDNSAKAQAALNTAVSLAPQDSIARQIRGLFLFELENYAEAIEDFTEILKHEPENSAIMMLFAQCYEKIDPPQPQLAYSNYKRAFELTGDNLALERMNVLLSHLSAGAVL